ncbi:MAG TPA: hypothetical protein PLQ13_13935 [Candidatus Krumholzibacteria bacterium]|nr:hypothetical protein [Candidatus Krumholzibacteria bacterium]
MKKLAVLILCVLGAGLALPQGALAQCTTGLDNPNGTNMMLVGQVPFVGTTHVGQQFTADCTAQLLDVTFRLEVDSSIMYGSQACLAAGDTVACVLYDDSDTELCRVEKILDFNRGTQAVTFDFSNLTYGLNPGTYTVMWETVTKSFLFFANGSDQTDGWLRTNTDGVWSDSWFGDAYVVINWDDAGVDNVPVAWSTVKADYR